MNLVVPVLTAGMLLIGVGAHVEAGRQAGVGAHDQGGGLVGAGAQAGGAGQVGAGAYVERSGRDGVVVQGLRGVRSAGAWVDPADPGGRTGARGEQNGRRTSLTLTHSKIVVTGNGVKGGRSDGYRLTSPCWYEPGPTPEEMLKAQENSADHFARIKADEASFLRYLQQFKDKIGKPGRWWTPAYNAADPRGTACWTDMELFVFVPPNTTPPQGITLRELADIARAALTVPEPTVKLNPDAKSYVNLPTWVWLDGLGETTRSATASIPGVMSATVVATLKSIKIDPGVGTDRAEVSEDCGPSGRPYVKGGTFRCGVRYLRASLDQPREVYQLTVTTVWPVEVADNVVPVQYAPVEVGVTRDVPVGEVQSTVTNS
ncbi:enoyl reductase [Nonomuraea muscovyensis]|uniref:Enoyl reductase n=1 Tax=Nonomuraea muscovyensis TaxID=1124761 RepID=A0A7X0F272_9ACTN|nr:hypothetical protein [Nonomuraea muscovyensis]MBB6350689.1 enoyl reductase [Nonomuraea muscovyensis]